VELTLPGSELLLQGRDTPLQRLNSLVTTCDPRTLLGKTVLSRVEVLVKRLICNLKVVDASFETTRTAVTATAEDELLPVRVALRGGITHGGVR
jgi:hypothetical protein